MYWINSRRQLTRGCPPSCVWILSTWFIESRIQIILMFNLIFLADWLLEFLHRCLFTHHGLTAGRICHVQTSLSVVPAFCFVSTQAHKSLFKVALLQLTKITSYIVILRLWQWKGVNVWKCACVGNFSVVLEVSVWILRVCMTQLSVNLSQFHLIC